VERIAFCFYWSRYLFWLWICFFCT